MFLCNGEELFAALYSKLLAESRFFRINYEDLVALIVRTSHLSRYGQSKVLQEGSLIYAEVVVAETERPTRFPRTASERSLANEPF